MAVYLHATRFVRPADVLPGLTTNNRNGEGCLAAVNVVFVHCTVIAEFNCHWRLDPLMMCGSHLVVPLSHQTQDGLDIARTLRMTPDRVVGPLPNLP